MKYKVGLYITLIQVSHLLNILVVKKLSLHSPYGL